MPLSTIQTFASFAGNDLQDVLDKQRLEEPPDSAGFVESLLVFGSFLRIVVVRNGLRRLPAYRLAAGKDEPHDRRRLLDEVRLASCL